MIYKKPLLKIDFHKFLYTKSFQNWTLKKILSDIRRISIYLKKFT